MMTPFAEMYDRPEVVAEYSGNQLLEQPEVWLWHRLVRQPGELAMLDLGVGTGRTTAFFAPFVRSYLGIDIAPRMIAACRQRLGAVPGCRFAVGDAAELGHLADASFDVVLFSFNGIDCLAPERRDVCLRSVRRVVRDDGVFLFSAHNLQAIDVYFRTPAAGSDEAQSLPPERRAKIARHNDPLASYAGRDWALFWDGVYGDDGGLRHMYVRPRQQLAQLHALGFPRALARSTVTGEEISAAECETVRELSVAYWCEAMR